MGSRLRIAALAVASALAPLAGAQDLPGFGDAPKVVLEAKIVPAKARAGEVVTVELKALIEPGWHIYGAKEEMGTPTTVEVTQADGLQPFGKAVVPAGEPHETAGITSYWVAGEARIVQRLTVPVSQQPGKVTIAGVVNYMACTEEVCDPPGRAEWKASVDIEAGPPRKEYRAKKVEVSAALRNPPARAGELAILDVTAMVTAGWHIYGARENTGDPTAIAITKSGGLQVGASRIPEGEPHDSGLAEPSYWLVGKVVLSQELVVPADAKPGEIEIAGELRYLPCTEELCDDPEAVPFTASLRIEAGEARPDRKPGAAPPAGPAPGKGTGPGEGKGAGKGDPQATLPDEDAAASNELAGKSLWLFLLLAIGGGLFALVMPCTYPMIPITISFFTKQAATRSGHALPMALTYGAGIIVIFTAIGVFFGSWIGPFAAHGITNLVIGIVFLIFALSLFGLITLEPPRFLMNYASKASMKGGYLGVFLMGATLVVTSFTCTAPFVGNVIALGALEGMGRVALGMAVFGLTMAVPFVFLALVPGKLQSMPGSGVWMNTFKVFLGFVEIAAALKFLQNAEIYWNAQFLTRELFLLLWAVIFAIAGLFLLGLIKFKGESGEIGPGRLTGAIAVLLLATYCVYGAGGNRLDGIMSSIVPPSRYGLIGAANDTGKAEAGEAEVGKTESKGPTIIEDDYDGAHRLALAEGKKLFINFTGVT